jgi:hypothetical protein
VCTAILRRQSLARQFAFVPARKRKPRQPRREREQRDAGKRDQHQRGEETRNVELDAGEQDLVREARGPAAGAGNEFRHHRANQCETARDAHAREEVRQRRRHT